MTGGGEIAMVAHKGAVHIIGLLAVLVLLCYSGTFNVFDTSYQNDNTLSDDFYKPSKFSVDHHWEANAHVVISCCGRYWDFFLMTNYTQ